MKIHIVQKGDTLWKIAQKYGVDFEEVKKMNAHVSDPDLIMPGMKIKIPTAAAPVKQVKKEEQKPTISVDVDIHMPKKKEQKVEVEIQQPPTVEPITLDVPKVEPKKKEEPKQDMPLLPPKPANIMPDMMEPEQLDDVTIPPAPDVPPIPTPPSLAPETNAQQPMPQPVPMPIPCIPITPIMPGYGFYPFTPPLYPMMPTWAYPQAMKDDCGCDEHGGKTPYVGGTDEMIAQPYVPQMAYVQQMPPMMPYMNVPMIQGAGGMPSGMSHMPPSPLWGQPPFQQAYFSTPYRDEEEEGR